MDRGQIEELREKVSCAAVLVRLSFALDRRESTRRALKFRRADDIVIVTHQGRGWWDPLSDAKGDVFRLLGHLERLPFRQALDRVRDLAGLPVPEITFAPRRRRAAPDASFAERWAARRPLWRGASGWRYLAEARAIPTEIIAAAATQGLLRQGPPGSVWMRHANLGGEVVGWEERGPNWRGFATGGHKTLFCFGRAESARICVTEAAIDALSLAAIEACEACEASEARGVYEALWVCETHEAVRSDTLYVSTGGGWSPTTDAALRALAAGRQLVAATDHNRQGEVYARRLEALAAEVRAGFDCLRPAAGDWNDVIRSGRRTKREEGGMDQEMRQAGRPVQGKLRPLRGP